MGRGIGRLSDVSHAWSVFGNNKGGTKDGNIWPASQGGRWGVLRHNPVEYMGDTRYYVCGPLTIW